MPKMLNDEAVEYEDGVPATEAQVRFPSFNTFETRIFGLVLSVRVLPLLFVNFERRWVKMLCHSCLGQLNQKWKRGNW